MCKVLAVGVGYPSIGRRSPRATIRSAWWATAVAASSPYPTARIHKSHTSSATMPGLSAAAERGSGNGQPWARTWRSTGAGNWLWGDTDELSLVLARAQLLVFVVCLAALLFRVARRFTLTQLPSLAARPLLGYDPRGIGPINAG
jgi:hypothetical protein